MTFHMCEVQDCREADVAVPMGKVGQMCRFRRVRSCGYVVLRGRRGTSGHSNMFQDASKIVLWSRRDTFSTCSEDVLHFSWQVQHTLDTSDVILRGRRSTLDVSCCVFAANRIVSAARSVDNAQIPWQAWHFVTCDENRRKPRTKPRYCGRSIRKLAGKR